MRERGNRRTYERQSAIDESRPNRRGVSANYLLNFSLPERRPPSPPQKRNIVNKPKSQKQYLHANYRFVLSMLPPVEDITKCSAEALVQWDNVEQVRVWKSDDAISNCPICLDRLQVPQSTRCGHVFCGPCILRYLSYDKRHYRRCPMCFESVDQHHLRSVSIDIVMFPPKLNSLVRFQLLKKSKSTLYPMISKIISQYSAYHVKAVPTTDDPEEKYSRVVHATCEYISRFSSAELEQLSAMSTEAYSCGEAESIPFIEEMIEMITKRLNKLQRDPSRNDDRFYIQQDRRDIKEPCHFFYQIDNGTYIVLHPLNMKCLLMEAEIKFRQASDSNNISGIETISSTMSTCSASKMAYMPEFVEGKVLELEQFVMNDEVQKRYRFLSHFPRCCIFYLCELDLYHYLSDETRSAFKKVLEKRKHRRKKHMRLEQESKCETDLIKQDDTHLIPPLLSPLESENDDWPGNCVSSIADRSFESNDVLETDESTHTSASAIARLENSSMSCISSPSDAVQPHIPSMVEDVDNDLLNITDGMTYCSAVCADTVSERVPTRNKKNRYKNKLILSTAQRRSYR